MYGKHCQDDGTCFHYQHAKLCEDFGEENLRGYGQADGKTKEQWILNNYEKRNYNHRWEGKCTYPVNSCLDVGLWDNRPVRSLLWQGERANQNDIQGGAPDGNGSNENNPIWTRIYWFVWYWNDNDAIVSYCHATGKDFAEVDNRQTFGKELFIFSFDCLLYLGQAI